MNTARIVVLAIAPSADVAACLASGPDSNPPSAAPIAQPPTTDPDADKAKLSDKGK
jgi:pilus assembly protein CpaB